MPGTLGPTELQHLLAVATIDNHNSVLPKKIARCNNKLKGLQILMDKVATEDARWTMDQIRIKLERLNSQYKEMYKGFMKWSIEYKKLEHTPKNDEELELILNGTWNLTNDERIGKHLTRWEIREEVQTKIKIYNLKAENQELETRVKQMDKILSPFRQGNTTTKFVL